MRPTDDPDVRAARAKVRVRPPLDDVEPAGSGRESVWRYPRPPRLEPADALVDVLHDGAVVVSTRRVWRVLETNSPPVFYLPEADLAPGVRLTDRAEQALCEWKGCSTYFDLRIGEALVEKAGWRFHDPFDDLGQGYVRLVGLVALLPVLFDCRLGGVRARPQVGGYYGGWITPAIAGPFKGGESTQDW